MSALLKNGITSVAVQAGLLYRDERGMLGGGGGISQIIMGVITIVVGIILSGVVVDTVSNIVTGTGDLAAGSAADSAFPGARSIATLIPTIYFAAVLVMGVGLIGIGAKSYYRRGEA